MPLKAFYFTHDNNARNDPKMIALRMKFGAAGVGLYWMTLEMMDEQTDGCLSDAEEMLDGYAWQCRVTNEDFRAFLDACFELGLFKRSDGRFWSDALLRRRSGQRKRLIKSRRAARSRWDAKSDAKPYAQDDAQGDAQPSELKDKIRKDNKEKESNTLSLAERERRFELTWKSYPNRQGKKAARRHYLATVKTDEDSRQCWSALRNYLRSDRVSKGFIQNGSTWFNDWQSWVNPTPQMMGSRDSERESTYGVQKTCERCGGNYWTNLGHPAVLCDARLEAQRSHEDTS